MVVVVEDEHVVLVVAPVPARLPQLLADQARGANLVEARLAADLSGPLLEGAPQRHAARMQEGRRRRLGVEGEEIELAAELAVIALLRLLQAPQVLVELVGGVPRGAVDALEHRPRLVAAPVGTRGVEQLEGAEPGGGLEVAAATEVLERAMAVEADRRSLGLGEVLDDLDLERLAALAHQVDRLRAWQVARSFEGQARGLLLAHLRLDLLEVRGRQRARQVEVVVEAVLDGRTDAELRLGEELEDGRSHHVRGAVPHGRQAVLRTRRERRGGVLGDLVSVDCHAPKGSA